MKPSKHERKREELLELDKRIQSKKNVIRAAESNFFKKPILDIKYRELDELIKKREKVARL